MTAILLQYDTATRDAALAQGFREQVVLVKRCGGQSTPENKRNVEQECFRLAPHEFTVGDTWGMRPD